MNEPKADLKMGLVIPALGGELRISEELAEKLRNFKPNDPPILMALPRPEPLRLTRQTHTFVTMDVPADVYEAIKAKFHAAGYDHVIHNQDQPDEALDMTGIAITKEKT